MTLFKTFWKVVYKYKGTIILYTVMLIIFGGINMSTNEVGTDFTNSKPDIYICDKDETALSSNLVDYMNSVSNLKNIDEKDIDDALFYRDLNYIVYIPDGYSDSILNGDAISIDIKSSGDYQSSLAEMLLKRYLNVQDIYRKIEHDDENLINVINNNLKNSSSINVKSKLDTTKTANASSYYSFASYSIMAVIIFIICLVISSFKEKNVFKRTLISSKNYRIFNFSLLISSFIYAVIVWILFNILGVILLGNFMFTVRGLVYMLNSFVFTFVSLTLALLISTVVNNKDAVSGIVNVVALGSAFLCGAFVPAEFLPTSVLRVAHALPAYWYINSNDLLETMETINFNTLEPIFINMGVMLLFALAFIILNNIISRYKRRIA